MGNTQTVRWERVELARERERGSWDRWSVQDAEIRGEWVLFAFDARRIYAPTAHPAIPHHFARLSEGSDRALIQFVQEYGRLGWSELINREDGSAPPRSDPWAKRVRKAHQGVIRAEGPGGLYSEPVEWIRAHAATVSWCLAGADAVRRRDKARCRDLSARPPQPGGCRGTLLPGNLLREGMRDKVSAEVFVGGMVEDYLWINLRGVRRRVLFRDGAFGSVWGGDSLLESIYTLVADAVTGGRLARCESCGLTFVRTHDHQRFCPPFEGQAKSACMNRERVKKYRERQRERLKSAK